MKKSSIVAIAIIAVAIGVVISTFGSSSNYITFKEAKQYAQEGNEQDYHVVGSLKKDASGEIVGMKYDPFVDANRFEFMMVDSLNNEELVIYNQPKPADLEKTEKLVVIGRYIGEEFHASNILLKCPSKYENESPQKE